MDLFCEVRLTYHYDNNTITYNIKDDPIDQLHHDNIISTGKSLHGPVYEIHTHCKRDDDSIFMAKIRLILYFKMWVINPINDAITKELNSLTDL